jgi:hypothetical protein
LQELVGFGHLINRQRRRIGAEGLDRLFDTGPHGPPVGDAGADVVERLSEALDQLFAVGIGIQARDVEMDQAFALAPCPLWQCFAVEAQELALLVTLHGDDRVSDQRNFDALLGELRHGRIDQEGHVVVENFEHGNLAPVRHRRIDHADIGTTGRASLHMFPGLFRKKGKRDGIVVGEVLDIGVVEQKLGKGPGSLARLQASGCLADQGCSRLVVTPRHNVLHFPRRPTAVTNVCLILECIPLSANVLTAIDRTSAILGLRASAAPDDNIMPERTRRELS